MPVYARRSVSLIRVYSHSASHSFSFHVRMFPNISLSIWCLLFGYKRRREVGIRRLQGPYSSDQLTVNRRSPTYRSLSRCFCLSVCPFLHLQSVCLSPYSN